MINIIIILASLVEIVVTLIVATESFTILNIVNLWKQSNWFGKFQTFILLIITIIPIIICYIALGIMIFLEYLKRLGKK